MKAYVRGTVLFLWVLWVAITFYAPCRATGNVRYLDRLPGAPRVGSATVLDSERQHLLILGGSVPDGRGGFETTDEFWRYSLLKQEWSLVGTSGSTPSPISLHAASYSAQTDEVIIYGGTRGQGPFTDCRRELWGYGLEHGSWRSLGAQASFPSGREQARIAIDPARQSVWMTFGRCGFAQLGDYARYDLAHDEWSLYAGSANSPAARYSHISAFDAANDRLVIYGGAASSLSGPTRLTFIDEDAATSRAEETLDNVWTLDPKTESWTMLESGDLVPPSSEDAVGAFDPISELLLVYGGRVLGGDRTPSGQPHGELWAYSLSEQKWVLITNLKNRSLRRWLASGTYCPCSGELFVHGGIDTLAFGPEFDVTEATHDDGFFISIERPAEFKWVGLSEASMNRSKAVGFVSMGASNGDSVQVNTELVGARLLDCVSGKTLQMAEEVVEAGHGRWKLTFDRLSPEAVLSFQRGSLRVSGRLSGDPIHWIASASASGERERFFKDRRVGQAKGVVNVSYEGDDLLLRVGVQDPPTRLILSDVRGRIVSDEHPEFARRDFHWEYRWQPQGQGGKRLARGIYYLRLFTSSGQYASKVLVW